VPDTPGVPDDVAALRTENERLRVLLEDKDAKIADLEARIARLERLISRNSGNSSMPPSGDDLPGKKPPEPWPRRGGGRKPGKQRGAAAQTYPDAIWPGQIADALRGLIHAANVARDQGLAAVPAEMTAEHLKLFRRGVAVGLSQVRRAPRGKQLSARMLLECLRDREADVLRFLTDTAIPPTSNQAERDLRPAKTQQKISGRLRSEKTTRDRYAVRGYASTAA
jgi:hypothetical protein